MWERLRHVLVWLSRINRCRGFGIQSPTDYRFVRYVVNEHWPYYKYDELGEHDSWLYNKLGRLYFRLANWRQPEIILTIGDAGCRNIPYLSAGCVSASVLSNHEGIADMLVVSSLLSSVESTFSTIVAHVGLNTLLVVEGIHIDEKMKRLWNDIKGLNYPLVTFDLYYCGIAVFDEKRTKQHYIVNF